MNKNKEIKQKEYADYDSLKEDFFKLFKEYSESDKKFPLNLSKEVNKDISGRYKNAYKVLSFNEKYENLFQKRYKRRDRVRISKSYAVFKALDKIDVEDKMIESSYKKMPLKLLLWQKRMLHSNILFFYFLRVIGIIIKGFFTMGKKGNQFSKQLLKNKLKSEDEIIKEYKNIFENKKPIAEKAKEQISEKIVSESPKEIIEQIFENKSEEPLIKSIESKEYKSPWT